MTHALALLLCVQATAEPARHAAAQESCLPVFRGLSIQLMHRDLAYAAAWRRQHQQTLAVSIRSDVMGDWRAPKRQFPALLTRYFHPGYRGKPWVRFDRNGQSWSVEAAAIHYADETTTMADAVAEDDVGLHLLELRGRTVAITWDRDWTPAPTATRHKDEPRRLALFEWQRDRFVFVDSAALDVWTPSLDGRVMDCIGNERDVWALKETGHVFVTDIACRTTLVFQPDGHFWGRLLVGWHPLYGEFDAAMEQLPRICRQGRDVVIRGPMLARMIGDSAVEIVPQVRLPGR